MIGEGLTARSIFASILRSNFRKIAPRVHAPLPNMLNAALLNARGINRDVVQIRSSPQVSRWNCKPLPH